MCFYFQGSKVFYLIEPTDTNIALYETWTSSAEQNTIFFGDQVKACYKVHNPRMNTNKIVVVFS